MAGGTVPSPTPLWLRTEAHQSKLSLNGDGDEMPLLKEYNLTEESARWISEYKLSAAPNIRAFVLPYFWPPLSCPHPPPRQLFYFVFEPLIPQRQPLVDRRSNVVDHHLIEMASEQFLSI